LRYVSLFDNPVAINENIKRGETASDISLSDMGKLETKKQCLKAFLPRNLKSAGVTRMTKNSSPQAGELEMAQQECNCPCLAGRVYSWRQVLTLTACIMGVLAALSAALVVILK